MSKELYKIPDGISTPKIDISQYIKLGEESIVIPEPGMIRWYDGRFQGCIVGSPGGWVNLDLNENDDAEFKSVRIGNFTETGRVWDIGYTAENVIGTMQITDDTNGPIFLAMRGRGSVSLPTAPIEGDRLLNFRGSGYTGTEWRTENSAGFSINCDDDWIPLSQPTRLDMYVVKPNSTEEFKIASASSSGLFEFAEAIKVGTNSSAYGSDGVIRFNGTNYQGYKGGTPGGWVNLDDQMPINIILSKKISLSAAEIRTLSSSPVEILPAPGPGKIYIIMAGVFELITPGSPYIPFDGDIFGKKLELCTEGANEPMCMTGSILDSEDNTSSFFAQVITAADRTTIIPNKRLLIRKKSDSTIGDGILDIQIWYMIVDL